MPDVPVNLPGNEPIDPGFGNPGSEEGQIDPEFGVTPPVYGGPVDPGFGNPGSEEGQRPQPPVENPIERPIDPGFGHTPPAPLCGMADCPLRPVQLEPLTAHVVNSSGSDGIGWRELTAVVGAIFITVNALTDTSLTSTAKLWIDAGLAILVAILFVAR